MSPHSQGKRKRTRAAKMHPQDTPPHNTAPGTPLLPPCHSQNTLSQISHNKERGRCTARLLSSYTFCPRPCPSCETGSRTSPQQLLLSHLFPSHAQEGQNAGLPPRHQACAHAADEVSKPGRETGPETDDVMRRALKAIGRTEFRGKEKLSLPQEFQRERKGWEWVDGGPSRPHGALHVTPTMTSVSRLLAVPSPSPQVILSRGMCPQPRCCLRLQGQLLP